MATDTVHEIESKLWDMANKLRGSMDASEYKNYIFAFMFYRYLSEKQNRYLLEDELVEPRPGQSVPEALMEELFGTDDLSKVRSVAEQSNGFKKLYREKTGPNGLPLTRADGSVEMEPVGEWVDDYVDYLRDCSNYLGYFISPFYSWDSLQKMVSEHLLRPSDYQDLFDAFSFSLGYNRTAQQDFEGIFNDVNLGDSRLGTTTNDRARALGRIVDLVESVDYQDENGRDVLGGIYEYLIKQFAANAGKKGGEFYTPHEVSLIISKIVTWKNTEPERKFTVFDPACGSGSLLLTVGREVPDGDQPGAISYYGQELNTTTYNLARMNLMMNHVGYDDMHLRNADTLGSDWPDGLDEHGIDRRRTFDAVVANPPYSAKWEADESYLKDPRFRDFGKLAPRSKADYAFLLDGLYHLNDQGVMAIVLPHGVLFRGAAEGVIRKVLIDKNRIDAVIGLPANLFYGTSIPTIIMVLKKNKTTRDILFIDASQEFKKDKNKNRLTPENIEKIFNAYKERQNIEKYAHVASIEEIRENDYNLNIPRYVDTSEEEEEIDLQEVDRKLAEVRAQIAKCQEEIDRQLRLLGVKP